MRVYWIAFDCRTVGAARSCALSGQAISCVHRAAKGTEYFGRCILNSGCQETYRANAHGTSNPYCICAWCQNVNANNTRKTMVLVQMVLGNSQCMCKQYQKIHSACAHNTRKPTGQEQQLSSRCTRLQSAPTPAKTHKPVLAGAPLLDPTLKVRSRSRSRSSLLPNDPGGGGSKPPAVKSSWLLGCLLVPVWASPEISWM